MKVSHLNLSYGAKIIYDDCTFHIEPGDKVGIVGVNGAGKTTLFRILLGQQTPDSGEIDLPELRLGHLPQEIIIPSEHANLTVWDYIADGRPIDSLQTALNAEYEKLAKYPSSATILARITELQDLIDSYDLSSFDHDLLRITEKMHLDSLLETPMQNLSGGQKSKVAFARVLFENAGLLLLDEPTNHLDTTTKDFVSNFLRNYNGTVLVISHDIDFLDTVTTKTLFVNKNTHKIKLYKGNYTAFRREYAAEKAAADQRISLQEREIKRLTEFVERAKNTKKANHAIHARGKSAEKTLNKRLATLETREAESAHVALRIAPAQQSGRTPLEVQNLTFAYPNGPEIYKKLSFMLDRGEKFLVVGENGAGKSTLLKLIVNAYQSELPSTTTTFPTASLSAPSSAARLLIPSNTANASSAIYRPNSSSTTTTPSTTHQSNSSDLTPAPSATHQSSPSNAAPSATYIPNSGSIIFSKNTTLAYYAQEFEILNEHRTILENVASYDFTDAELRSILSNFLFYGDDIHQKVATLSPGEKARVALCKTLLLRTNLILLDEPTNHFDPETQKIIGENLRDYSGTIVMVSHNPAFVEQIGITRMLIIPPRGSSDLCLIKNYSPELLEYYYYLNSDLV